MAQMVIYVDDEIKEAVAGAAAAEGRSVSNMVRIWIERALAVKASQNPQKKESIQPKK